MLQRSWDQTLLATVNALKTWHVAIVIAVVGVVFFFTGLSGGFQGDDDAQIVDNTAVHSLGNIGLFFQSSTFWNGEALVGDFYRPMMTVTFSIIYTLFGANPVAFHVIQLIIYMACAFLLFQFLKTFFKPALSLLIALLFLIHPINSQIVFSIPSMQEPLFFLFGISALLILSRSQTMKSYIVASILLFLSLLSKETAIVFVCLAILYLFLYKKERAFLFVKFILIPVGLFLILRFHAVGLFQKTLQVAPIDMLNFGERMLTVPSMVIFYVSKFLLPQTLATSYYWTHRTVTFEGVLIPLVIMLVIFAGLIYAARRIYKKGTKNDFIGFLFFAAWASLGLAPYLQIIPLDMTACETWFFCAMPGFLGMIAIILKVLVSRIQAGWVLIACIPLLLILGIRTAVRGIDYHSQFTLSSKDIAVSQNNYLAMNNLAKTLIDQGKLDQAMPFARQSIAIYPSVSNYTNLGVIQQKQNDFTKAKTSYLNALKYGSLAITYENLAIVELTLGNTETTTQFLYEALTMYPRSNRLWTYLAIQEAENGAVDKAKNGNLARVAIRCRAVRAVPRDRYRTIA